MKKINLIIIFSCYILLIKSAEVEIEPVVVKKNFIKNILINDFDCDIQDIINPIRELVINPEKLNNLIKNIFVKDFKKEDFNNYFQLIEKVKKLYDQKQTVGLIIPKHIGENIPALSRSFNELICNQEALKVTLGYILLGQERMSQIKEQCESEKIFLSVEFMLANKFIFTDAIKNKAVDVIRKDNFKIGSTMSMLYILKLFEISAFSKKYKFSLMSSLFVLFGGSFLKKNQLLFYPGMQNIITFGIDNIIRPSQFIEKSTYDPIDLFEKQIKESQLYKKLNENFKNNNGEDYEFSFVMDQIQKLTLVSPATLALVNLIFYNILLYSNNPSLAKNEILKMINLPIDQKEAIEIENEDYIKKIMSNNRTEESLSSQLTTVLYRKIVLSQFRELELCEGMVDLMKMILINPGQFNVIIKAMIPIMSKYYGPIPKITLQSNSSVHNYIKFNQFYQQPKLVINHIENINKNNKLDYVI